MDIKNPNRMGYKGYDYRSKTLIRTKKRVQNREKRFGSCTRGIKARKMPLQQRQLVYHVERT